MNFESAQEMTLDEWCERLTPTHRARKELAALKSSHEGVCDALQGLLDALALGPLAAAAKFGPDVDLNEIVINAARNAQDALATASPPVDVDIAQIEASTDAAEGA